MQEEDILVLIYFTGRGKLQPIRNLVAFLGCNFYQVHLNNEETKKNLPQNIKNSLKGIKIDKNSLPMLIHKDYQIYDTYPIISYICRNFRNELFGRSIRQRAKVNELLENIILKELPITLEIFAFLESTNMKTKEQTLKDKRILYQKIMNESGFVREICEYLQKQDKENTFVLQDITFIDFYFMEICLKMVGIFKDLQEKKYCAIQIFFKGIFKCQQKGKQTNNLKYISTMIKYLNFTRSLPFYTNYKTYLEQFSLICPKFSPGIVEGFRRIWTEDSIFIK